MNAAHTPHPGRREAANPGKSSTAANAAGSSLGRKLKQTKITQQRSPSLQSCPLCFKQMSQKQLLGHVDLCLAMQDSRKEQEVARSKRAQRGVDATVRRISEEEGEEEEDEEEHREGEDVSEDECAETQAYGACFSFELLYRSHPAALCREGRPGCRGAHSSWLQGNRATREAGSGFAFVV